MPLKNSCERRLDAATERAASPAVHAEPPGGTGSDARARSVTQLSGMPSSLAMLQEDGASPRMWCRQELLACLNLIWQRYFLDVPRVNIVSIDYCHPWKSRLGLIRLSLDSRVSFIGINTLLQLRQVPDYVLMTTIAHEIVHYSHGFGSPLPRCLPHPHANRVVDKALEQREMGIYLKSCNEWIDKNWYTFYNEQRALLPQRFPRT